MVAAHRGEIKTQTKPAVRSRDCCLEQTAAQRVRKTFCAMARLSGRVSKLTLVLSFRTLLRRAQRQIDRDRNVIRYSSSECRVYILQSMPAPGFFSTLCQFALRLYEEPIQFVRADQMVIRLLEGKGRNE